MTNLEKADIEEDELRIDYMGDYPNILGRCYEIN